MSTQQRTVAASAGDGWSGRGSTPRQNCAERQVSLRIPETILSEIDDLVRDRPVRTPRHTWLMEAVVEKLQREKNSVGGDHGTQ